jgi:hypothetical protein
MVAAGDQGDPLAAAGRRLSDGPARLDVCLRRQVAGR